MISDTIASGRSREDRLPGVLISKQERTRLDFCIRTGINDQSTSTITNKTVGGPKIQKLTKSERGNAIPIRHLSLAAVVEIAEELESDLLKKKGKQNYTVSIDVLDPTSSQNTSYFLGALRNNHRQQSRPIFLPGSIRHAKYRIVVLGSSTRCLLPHHQG